MLVYQSVTPTSDTPKFRGVPTASRSEKKKSVTMVIPAPIRMEQLWENRPSFKPEVLTVNG